MVPDSTVLVSFIVKLAQKLGVDILPKSLKKKTIDLMMFFFLN